MENDITPTQEVEQSSKLTGSMEKEVDYSLAQEIQLSNDAFFYLKNGEQPLDEDNIEEAEEIRAMFPDGFEICDEWTPVEDSDMIEAIFVPYHAKENDYDEYHSLTNCEDVRIKWLDANTVRHWIVGVDGKPRAGQVRGECICKVYTSKYGGAYYETGNIGGSPPTGMMLFLKRFKKRGA